MSLHVCFKCDMVCITVFCNYDSISSSIAAGYNDNCYYFAMIIIHLLCVIVIYVYSPTYML